MSIFKRKKNKYASPYYGGNGALFNSSAMPLVKDEQRQPAPQPAAKAVTPAIEAPDWEQRRFELVRMFMAQERRSVVLGKLKANTRQIAATARSLADAAIRELKNHPYKESNEDERGREMADEPGDS